MYISKKTLQAIRKLISELDDMQNDERVLNAKLDQALYILVDDFVGGISIEDAKKIF